jgi:5-methylcytosine-specific restriction endonuclease McrA
MKPCSRCGIVKPFTDFYSQQKSKIGYSSRCRQCQKEIRKPASEQKLYMEDWRKNNKEEIKKKKKDYYLQNAEHIKAKSAANFEKNKERRLQYSKARYLAKKDEIQVYKQEYYVKNLPLIRQQRLEYWKQNRDRLNEAQREYKQANPDRVREIRREWNRKNPEAVRTHDNKKRAMRLRAPGKFTKDDVKKLLALQKYTCVICRSKLTKYHVDHKIPLARGGSNDPENLQILCPPCNQSKGAKDPIEFMQQRGFLL